MARYPFSKRRENYFIAGAVKHPGALHRQLGVPKDERLPRTFLHRIQGADTGDTVENPTDIGVRSIKVTKLLKERVNLAITLERIGDER